MKRKTTILLSISLIIFGIAFLLNIDGEEDEILDSRVIKGNLEMTVNSIGELESKESFKIFGPNALNQFKINQITLSHIVDEGTKLKKGDYLAQLDPSPVGDLLNDSKVVLDELISKLHEDKLDTSIQLSELRTEISSITYRVQEKEIELAQSKYEPTAVIQGAQLNLQQVSQELYQKKSNYQLNKNKLKEQINSTQKKINDQQELIKRIEELMESLTIKAPNDGMVIYAKNWNGEKITSGNTISSWRSVIAELPNLNKLVSKAFVNEIDISKVEVGQQVEISLPAIPEEIFQGQVSSISNIGQKLEGKNAKIFEVIITIKGQHDRLRPSMTTNNKIKTAQFNNVHYVPLESVFRDSSYSYVFIRKNTTVIKQEVSLGPSNNQYIIIKDGLKENQRILIASPSTDNIETIRL